MDRLARLILTLSLSGAFVGAPSLLPDSGPLSAVCSSASAADFTGRIKNVRIKKRRVGSGFKVITRTQSSSSTSNAGQTVTTTFEALDGGPALPISVASASVASTVRFDTAVQAPLDTSVGTPLFDVQLEGADGSSSSASIPLSPGVRTPWQLTEGTGATLRVSAKWIDGDEPDTSVVRLFVRGDNAAWQASSLTGVDGWISLDGIVYANSPLVENRINERFVDVIDAPVEPDGFTYTITTTVTDPAGNVLDSGTSTATVGAEDAIVAGPATTRVSAKADGTAKLKATTSDPTGNASALSVELIDTSDGSVVLSETLSAPSQVQRLYNNSNLAFDGGESPVGYTYLVLVDLIDGDGDPVGQQREAEVVILGADETVVAAVAEGGGADGVELLTVMIHEQEDGTFASYVGVQGSGVDAVSANVIFEEPFEGPAPLEPEYSTELVNTLRSWSTTSAVAAPAVAQLSLTDANGTLGGTIELPETLKNSGASGNTKPKSSSYTYSFWIKPTK